MMIARIMYRVIWIGGLGVLLVSWNGQLLNYNCPYSYKERLFLQFKKERFSFFKIFI